MFDSYFLCTFFCDWSLCGHFLMCRFLFLFWKHISLLLCERSSRKNYNVPSVTSHARNQVVENKFWPIKGSRPNLPHYRWRHARHYKSRPWPCNVLKRRYIIFCDLWPRWQTLLLIVRWSTHLGHVGKPWFLFNCRSWASEIVVIL